MDDKTLCYVSHDDVADRLAKGWKHVPGLEGTHHGEHAVYMEPPLSATDTQIGGAHYKDMAIQPAEFLHKNGVPYLEGSAIYYLLRHKKKGGAEDIRKVMHTCELILELEYGQKG